MQELQPARPGGNYSCPVICLVFGCCSRGRRVTFSGSPRNYVHPLVPQSARNRLGKSRIFSIPFCHLSSVSRLSDAFRTTSRCHRSTWEVFQVGNHPPSSDEIVVLTAEASSFGLFHDRFLLLDSCYHIRLSYDLDLITSRRTSNVEFSASNNMFCKATESNHAHLMWFCCA